MKDVIYLVVDRYGVKRMTKKMPSLYTGEFPLKVEVTVEQNAFQNPTVTKQVVVEDWREGIDVSDVDFKETFITEKEAEIIRAQRLERMKEILETQGYEITKKEQS